MLNKVPEVFAKEPEGMLVVVALDVVALRVVLVVKVLMLDVVVAMQMYP